MNFPERGIQIIDALATAHADLAKGTDDQRRQLVQLIGEQFCSEFGPRWGNKKRAGLSDDARSKDAIAYLEDDGTCSVWDWQNGSTRERGINAGDAPNYPHLPTSEATFMALSPVNHLGAQPQPGSAPPPSAGPSFDADVRASLGRIERDLADLKSRPSAAAAVTQPPPIVALPVPAQPMAVAAPTPLPAGAVDIGDIVKIAAGLIAMFQTKK